MFDIDQLQQIIGNNRYIQQWFDSLTKLLPNYDITSNERIAAFLAECCEESINFTAVSENLNYRPETLMRIWPHHFPTIEIANQYAHEQEKIANLVYANKIGNGNEASGDGWRFCGRGLIQLTGRENYQQFADSMGMDIEDVSEYLETFEGAIQGACFFWKRGNLNSLADQGEIDKITRVINPAGLGIDERRTIYENALKIL